MNWGKTAVVGFPHTRESNVAGQCDYLVYHPDMRREGGITWFPLGLPTGGLYTLGYWHEQISGMGRNTLWKWKGSSVNQAGDYLGKDKREGKIKSCYKSFWELCI